MKVTKAAGVIAFLKALWAHMTTLPSDLQSTGILVASWVGVLTLAGGIVAAIMKAAVWLSVTIGGPSKPLEPVAVPGRLPSRRPGLSRTRRQRPRPCPPQTLPS